jgi:nucleotide-binding universal stress UspA family protein
MIDDEDVSLLDLALGLRDDPEFQRAVRGSSELRQRFREVERDLRRLDDELRYIERLDGHDQRRLRPGSWRLLLAVDDSQPSARAIDTAEVLAAMREGEVFALHLREMGPGRKGPGSGLETPEEAQEFVDAIVERLRRAGVRAGGETCISRPGRVGRDIADAARRIGADLIITGSRGQSDLACLLGSSVAHQAIRRAGCPVLVVR